MVSSTATRIAVVSLVLGVSPALARPPAGGNGHGPFTIEEVKSYPFPTELTAAASGARVAWPLDEQGRRNVWVAEGPEFAPRRLTSYTADDGQELSSLSISADGRWVVFVRGGDHGGNWDDAVTVNATSVPTPAKVQVWSVPFAGGEPKALGGGDLPVLSPKDGRVAFETKDHQIWAAPVDGSAPAKALVTVRGESGGARWSPDGSRLAFVSNRGEHALIGVYTDETTPIVWVAPS